MSGWLAPPPPDILTAFCTNSCASDSPMVRKLSWKFYDTVDDQRSALNKYESIKATAALSVPPSAD
jgi:hypothetical protein